MLSRRGLLPSESFVRLPWLAADVDFSELCTRCGDCISACPQHIIVKGSGGFPRLDFKQGQCDFCTACVDACQVPGLFDRSRPAFNHQLQINEHCLPQRGVACQSCADVCDRNAIRFHWNAAHMREPVIDNDNCSRCGACIAVCPTDALTLSFDNTAVTT